MTATETSSDLDCYICHLVNTCIKKYSRIDILLIGLIRIMKISLVYIRYEILNFVYSLSFQSDNIVLNHLICALFSSRPLFHVSNDAFCVVFYVSFCPSCNSSLQPMPFFQEPSNALYEGID